MRKMEFTEYNGQILIEGLKFPPEWDLMNLAEKDRFLEQVGREPTNIIPFRHPQYIDLNKFF